MSTKIGKLFVYPGPVSCGKSQKLFSIASNSRDGKRQKVIAINSELDKRDPEAIFSTHRPGFDVTSALKGIETIKKKSLSEVDVKNFDVIIIDEVHFFDHEDTFKTIISWVNVQCKEVHCAGIAISWQGKQFTNGFFRISDILIHADHVEFMKAVCVKCCQDVNIRDSGTLVNNAFYSAKISGSNSEIQSGGIETFVPMCRLHFLNHLKETEIQLYHDMCQLEYDMTS